MVVGDRSVFISYRRRLSEALALLVRNDLVKHRFDVFMDVENLDSGEFERTILSQIEAREHFIVLLQPGSLDQVGEPGDWLRREIAHALAHGRNVVPATANGFEFRRDLVLPPDVARLPSFNAVPIQPGYFDAAMERLCTRFLKMPPNSPVPLQLVTRTGESAQDKQSPIRQVKPTSVGVPASYASGVTESVIPRFDGLYVNRIEGEKYSSYIRFFRSGKACVVTSSGSASQVIRWLVPDPNNHDGEYSQNGSNIKITDRSSSGVVKYSGTISKGALEVQLHYHSYINGHESSGVWRFERTG